MLRSIYRGCRFVKLYNKVDFRTVVELEKLHSPVAARRNKATETNPFTDMANSVHSLLHDGVPPQQNTEHGHNKAKVFVSAEKNTMTVRISPRFHFTVSKFALSQLFSFTWRVRPGDNLGNIR